MNPQLYSKSKMQPTPQGPSKEGFPLGQKLQVPHIVCAFVLEFSKETHGHSSSSSITPAGDNHSDYSALFLGLMISTPFSKNVDCTLMGGSKTIWCCFSSLLACYRDSTDAVSYTTHLKYILAERFLNKEPSIAGAIAALRSEVSVRSRNSKYIVCIQTYMRITQRVCEWELEPDRSYRESIERSCFRSVLCRKVLEKMVLEQASEATICQAAKS